MESWLNTFTEDAVFMMPDHPLISGKQQIKGFAKEMFGAVSMELDFSFDELEVSGSWAWGRGKFTSKNKSKSSGEASEMVGKFIDIFKKQEDGDWKFARVITNTDEPNIMPV
jgi:ketosteroid isomerase-like protein